MKVAFLISMLVILLVSLFACKKLIERKNTISKRMINVLLPAGISIIAHISVIFVSNYVLANFFYAIYFASATWISASIFYFCIYYVGDRLSKKIFLRLIMPLSILDSILLIINIFHPYLYDVTLKSYWNDVYFRYTASPLFLLHLFYGYVLLIFPIIILIKKIITEPQLFRYKYLSLIFFVFLILVSNIIYVFTDFPLNISIFIYAVSFISIYYVVNKQIPEKLIQKTLGLIVDNLKNGIILRDNDGFCIYINEFVRDTFSCDKNTALSLDILAEFHNRRIESGLEGEASFSDEFDYNTESKRLVLQISDFYIREKNSVIGRYYLIEDITISKNQIYEEQMLRTRDKLTGLYNREYFFEKVEHRLKYDRFTPYYLIVSDIVNFKLINDLYGKPFGDTILMRYADSLRKFVAPDDIYARLYNDHFILLVPKRHFDEEKYTKAFKNNMSYLNNFSYRIVGHMGIYEVDDYALPVSVMCDRAFLALRLIKNDYKNAYAYYDESMRKEVLQMQMLMNELPQALKDGQLKMYLQPQVNKEGIMSGAEALVRWHHPEKGIIPPADFIQIIEKINIISDVDRYIWEEACKKLAEWKISGRENLKISVNISAKDFFTMDLYETFTGLVEKYNISPANLNLEITETAVIMDLDNQSQLLDSLRSAGFIIEMDDFGSGYSSLNMLKDISVDVLKIDMAFLQKSKDDKKSQIILEKIIMLAKELGMKVITEGVESENQVAFLSKAGADLFQGFYFSRPLTVEDFEKKYFN
ncbi:MAG: EAL domain-containing protein [Treponema sp.]|nr:EAL domain-containing protein [Treponema sp.]